MLRRLLRDKWAYFGLALLGGGLFLLTGCSSDIAFSSKQNTSVPPGLLGVAGEAAKAIGGITGIPWLDTVGGILVSLGGGGLLAKRAVKAYDDAPYTAEDAAGIKAAEKPSA